MTKHRLTRGIKNDLLLIFYQEPLPNKQRHKAVYGALLKKNPSQQLPYQVEEELIPVLMPWVSALSQNTVWQWPDMPDILLFKKRAAGSSDQPRGWNCSKCLWWSTSKTLSRIKDREKLNCLRWGVGHVSSWISSLCLSIILSRKDKSNIQVVVSRYLLSPCLNQTYSLLFWFLLPVLRSEEHLYKHFLMWPWSLFNTMGSTL